MRNSFGEGTARRPRAALALVASVVVFAVAPLTASWPARADEGPRRGRFRVTLLGITVNRETWDDALERDGKRDEVYVVAQAVVYGADAGVRTDSGPLRSRVMGDPTGRPERIAAGSTPANPGLLGIGASDAGGLRTGDRFPTAFAAPPASLSGDGPPMLLWEGELVSAFPAPTAETSVALIVLTVWEWDAPGHDAGPVTPPPVGANEVNYLLTRVHGLPDTTALPLPPPLCHPEGCHVEPWPPPTPTPTPPVQLPQYDPKTLLVRDNDPWTVTLLKGGVGSEVVVGGAWAGDPRNRPVGMHDAGGRYEFRPLALALPYQVAAGGGVADLRYRDDDRLKGDYTLTVLVERLP